MNLAALHRELKFLLGQRFVLGLLVVAFLLSCLAVMSGLNEAKTQQDTIDQLKTQDAAERHNAIAGHSDFGSAAYYIFHYTYDPPGDLAFAAMGARHEQPWQHRIRMLALEGQIYESDTANPELAFAGHFDFALLVAVLTPLFLILLLHDLKAAEKAAGRYELLVATGGSNEPFKSRARVRVALLAAAVLLPFISAALGSGVSLGSVTLFSLVCLAQILFWSFVCVWVANKAYDGPTLATVLVAIWLGFTFVIPSLTSAVIAWVVPTPSGGDIVMTQREAVNDAWDLPKQATMEPFIAEHPEWAEYASVSRPFEWKWYFAFQQVGDQTAAEISEQRQAALQRRQEIATWAAVLSPASLTQLGLRKLAGTDSAAARSYQQRVRDFHASLRDFYYPKLFKDVAYDVSHFDDLPEFEAGS
jgi:ABC-2 type transport system permease protein